jgi:hypothetical protein
MEEDTLTVELSQPVLNLYTSTSPQEKIRRWFVLRAREKGLKMSIKQPASQKIVTHHICIKGGVILFQFTGTTLASPTGIVGALIAVVNEGFNGLSTIKEGTSGCQ